MKKIFLIMAGALLGLFLFEVGARILSGDPAKQDAFRNLNRYYYVFNNKPVKKVRNEKGEELYHIAFNSFYRNYQDDYRRITFPKLKDNDTIRLFIIGGSVAYNYPLAYTSYLENILGSSSSNNFEVINAGMGGYNSFQVKEVFNKMLSYQPDGIILISGNNIFVRPRLTSPFFKKKLFFKINKMMSNFWFYIIFQRKVFINYFCQRSTEGLKCIDEYKENIDYISETSKDKNIPLVILTLPANTIGDPPYGKCQGLDNKYYALGRFNLDVGEYDRAVQYLKKFIAENPLDLYGHFFLAEALRKNKRYAKSRKHYLMALTPNRLYDISRKCWPEINDFLRSKEGYKTIEVLDWERIISDEGEGLPGYDRFSDGCHFWESYYRLLSEKIAEKIKGLIDLGRKGIDKEKISQSRDFKSKSNSEKSEIILGDGYSQLINEYEDKYFSIFSERAVYSIMGSYYYNTKLFDDITRLKKIIYQDFSQNWWAKDLDTEQVWDLFLIHAGEAMRRKNKGKLSEKILREVDNTEYPGYHFCRAMLFYKKTNLRKSRNSFSKAIRLLRGDEGSEFIRFYMSQIGK